MTETMEYTGERMVPEKADPNTFWEHIYRYRFAAPSVKGLRVLDIACGEGYGAAGLLRAGAASLTGVDVSPQACAHAARRYGLNTRVGDAENIPLADASVDVVVSFETIEHLAHPEVFLTECARVLVRGGKLIVSTPNREIYDELAPNNPYHLKELNRKEFVELLGVRFENIQMYTQRPRLAGWWTPRVFAAEKSYWQVSSRTARARTLLRKCCREAWEFEALTEARADPIAAILKRPQFLSHLGNPYSIRPETSIARESPVYYIAEAVRRQ